MTEAGLWGLPDTPKTTLFWPGAGREKGRGGSTFGYWDTSVNLTKETNRIGPRGENNT